jgi:pyruvate dehydrogenase E2 component (dihydrolipoamide acetyltransferase)
LLIPDLGEASSASVIEVLVQPGDKVEKEQALAILEGDKATMELPAEQAGVIEEIYIKVGDNVKTNDKLVKIKKQIVKEVQINPLPQKTQPKEALEITEPIKSNMYASPSVRKLARQLGVDLSSVKPSGKKQRVTKLDVKSFVKNALANKSSTSGFEIAPWPKLDLKDLGDVTVVPLNNIKQISGSFLHRNWVKIPHVTQFEQADITDLEAWRKENKEAALELGCKISPLILVLKAVVEVLKLYPSFNSSLSNDGKSLIQKNYYNIGVAVDSPSGLLVPVIKDVDKKSIVELAKEIASVAKQAREKGLSANQMKNSTFTISSLGGIGGTYFTPIINAPDVAILGLSRSELQPKYIDNKLKPRLMLPLSLSYDHRVIDGADGARFMVELSKQLAAFHVKFKLTERVAGEINE